MKSRRSFSSEFKTKVVLEALSERYTMSELAQRHKIHPQQITNWKKLFLDNASLIFDNGPSVSQARSEEEVAQLYEKIGQQQMEIEFLKKTSRALHS